MTEQKKKCRPWLWVVIGIFTVLIFLILMVVLNLPKQYHVSDSGFDLTSLTEGIYQGECDNGLVYVKVEVTIQDYAIAEVRILEHRNGLGEAAETIVDDVVGGQSVEVDTVSGATISSLTILKAIENALANE